MPTQPNIILINCDDLGYGDLGCYGSPVNRTPAIDRLAAEGMRFTDFYMASPVCSPSRGAMMTGCYPPRIGFSDFEGKWVLFPGQGVGLHPEERTVARLLGAQGYATMLIGKWHCGDQPDFLPTRHGFDRYFGLPYSNDMGIMKNGGKFCPLPLVRDETVVQEQPAQEGLTERYVEEALGFIRVNRARPFFLYLAHMHVHRPHLVASRFLAEAQNGPYGAAVEAVDWATEMLLFELSRLGLEENTLVIFTSDNGSRGDSGGSNAPLRGRKGTTWEGGMRVPCIARWPGRIPAGGTCAEVACSLDFLPTFTALAGAEAPGDRAIDGRDLRPLLFAAPDAQSPHEAFYYFHQGRLEAVRCGQWKRHFCKGADELCELYDLVQDPAETTDLAAQHPALVSELDARCAGIRAELGDRRLGLEGGAVRPIGQVEQPMTLTTYHPAHPYMIAEYDGECG
jgi:arylsulfatase A